MKDKRKNGDYDEIEIMDFNHESRKKTEKKKPKNLEERLVYNALNENDDEEDDDEAEKAATKREKQNVKRKLSEERNAEPKIRNREFAVVAYFFLTIFICLSGYFCYFLAFRSEDFINSSYNPRLATLSNYTIRGDILSADQKVLATTTTAAGQKEVRTYPYGNEYAHVIGYSINGMAGVEQSANFNLLRSHTFILNRLMNEIENKKSQGDSVVTTLDSKIQDVAYDGMGKYNGAAVVLDPKTGKILAMVSKPDFDPNTLENDWTDLTTDENSSALLNRATQGQYPPGSTFKILTTLEYLKEGGSQTDKTFDCKGAYTYNNYTIHCFDNEVHGTQTLKMAFGNSCNVAFSQIGLKLDPVSWKKNCEKMLFNQTLPTKLQNVKNSTFSLDKNAVPALRMQTGIGQGNTLVTPLHMAMITSAIANDGVLMEPYVLDYTKSDNGTVVKRYSKTKYGSLLSVSSAKTLQEYMRYVVTDGTAKALNSDLYTAYGKTGTAEYNEDKNAHSWFVGYAEKDGKKVCVAIIMEGAGQGSRHAVPLAKKIFETYFSEKE